MEYPQQQQPMYPMPPAAQPKRDSGIPLAVISLGILVLAIYLFSQGIMTVSDPLIMSALWMTIAAPIISAIDVFRKRYFTFSIIVTVLTAIPAGFVLLMWIVGAVFINSMF